MFSASIVISLCPINTISNRYIITCVSIHRLKEEIHKLRGEINTSGKEIQALRRKEAYLDEEKQETLRKASLSSGMI